MQSRELSMNLGSNTEHRDPEPPQATGTGGLTPPERTSVSLLVTIYADLLQHLGASGSELRDEKVSHSQRPVLALGGNIPVEIKLMPEQSERAPGRAGLVLPPSELPPAVKANGSDNPWLDLGQSAGYLGISTSTLYKYSSQRKIESRKVAGKLQFRKSELDAFLEKQIRPARRSANSPGIITSALCSGK